MPAEDVRDDETVKLAGTSERRSFPRHAVDCPAEILRVSGSAHIRGRLRDLSLGGCLVVAEDRYTAGILVRVEVHFQLRGIVFRIVGVTVGSRGAKVFAVRFLDFPERRRRELAEVLAEVEVWNAARPEVQEAVVDASPETAVLETADGTSDGPVESAGPLGPKVAADRGIVIELPVWEARQTARAAETATPPEPGIAAGASAAVRTVPRERRAQGRHAVDTRAKLLLIKTAISMPGRIMNLSLGGCRIRTDERFNVGIYVRVEAEFYLHGLPFRMGGVSQAILDKNTIGIRFLDMSDRRRDKLSELIAEIDEAEALERVAGQEHGLPDN